MLSKDDLAEIDHILYPEMELDILNIKYGSTLEVKLWDNVEHLGYKVINRQVIGTKAKVSVGRDPINIIINVYHPHYLTATYEFFIIGNTEISVDQVTRV